MCKESTLQPFWPLSQRKMRSPKQNAISRCKLSKNRFQEKDLWSDWSSCALSIGRLGAAISPRNLHLGFGVGTCFLKSQFVAPHALLSRTQPHISVARKAHIPLTTAFHRKGTTRSWVFFNRRVPPADSRRRPERPRILVSADCLVNTLRSATNSSRSGSPQKQSGTLVPDPASQGGLCGVVSVRLGGVL